MMTYYTDVGYSAYTDAIGETDYLFDIVVGDGVRMTDLTGYETANIIPIVNTVCVRVIDPTHAWSVANGFAIDNGDGTYTESGATIPGTMEVL